MKKTRCTGRTCVGDVRLAPLDIGFDIRVVGNAIQLPKQFTSVGLEQDGDTWFLEGSREELVAAIKAAGYEVVKD